jgi:uncharacterized protein YjbI with pentapeptide repeats
VNLDSAYLYASNLSWSNLSAANLSGAIIQGACFAGTDFFNTTMPDGSLFSTFDAHRWFLANGGGLNC